MQRKKLVNDVVDTEQIGDGGGSPRLGSWGGAGEMGEQLVSIFSVSKLNLKIVNRKRNDVVEMQSTLTSTLPCLFCL